ncbi:hypothetical protein K470DRAFT_254001 [Piedraia hortae CBS 480.64]|uniref:Uncharacterized protein n=1 Tax=Piedraia hortae CBS 480.64 TaxID=1314780 RepID=A0A6A7CAV0_9PEZI|nr:hypothetical protein K470DRAFT_254001 [Piedraia hortae CBS 480.64]
MSNTSSPDPLDLTSSPRSSCMEKRSVPPANDMERTIKVPIKGDTASPGDEPARNPRRKRKGTPVRRHQAVEPPAIAVTNIDGAADWSEDLFMPEPSPVKPSRGGWGDRHKRRSLNVMAKSHGEPLDTARKELDEALSDAVSTPEPFEDNTRRNEDFTMVSAETLQEIRGDTSRLTEGDASRLTEGDASHLTGGDHSRLTEGDASKITEGGSGLPSSPPNKQQYVEQPTVQLSGYAQPEMQEVQQEVLSIFSNRPLKPPRGKIPRTWRRSSGMDFHYSDSPTHGPPQKVETQQASPSPSDDDAYLEDMQPDGESTKILDQCDNGILQSCKKAIQPIYNHLTRLPPHQRGQDPFKQDNTPENDAGAEEHDAGEDHGDEDYGEEDYDEENYAGEADEYDSQATESDGEASGVKHGFDKKASEVPVREVADKSTSAGPAEERPVEDTEKLAHEEGNSNAFINQPWPDSDSDRSFPSISTDYESSDDLESDSDEDSYNEFEEVQYTSVPADSIKPEDEMISDEDIDNQEEVEDEDQEEEEEEDKEDEENAFSQADSIIAENDDPNTFINAAYPETDSASDYTTSSSASDSLSSYYSELSDSKSSPVKNPKKRRHSASEDEDRTGQSNSYYEDLNLVSPQKVAVNFGSSSIIHNTTPAIRPIKPLPRSKTDSSHFFQQPVQPQGIVTTQPAATTHPQGANILSRLTNLTTWLPPNLFGHISIFSPKITPTLPLSTTQTLISRYGTLPPSHPWTLAHMRILHRMLNSPSLGAPIPPFPTTKSLINKTLTSPRHFRFVFTEDHARVVTGYTALLGQGNGGMGDALSRALRGRYGVHGRDGGEKVWKDLKYPKDGTGIGEIWVARCVGDVVWANGPVGRRVAEGARRKRRRFG